MLQSEAEVTAVLHGTLLQGREVVRLEPPGPGYEAVLAVDVEGLDLFQAWQVLRERVGQTGRWPVLTVFWVGMGDGLREMLDTGDLFSRFYYLEEASAGRAGDTPADILKAALSVDVRASLTEMSQADEHANAMARLRPVDVMRSELEMTQYLCGMAPEIEDVEQFVAQHALTRQSDIEAWLLRWEQAHCPTEAVAGFAEKKGHQEWFEPEGHVYATLLLMPFTEGEATLAYMNWYASERRNSQFLVALLRSWREKYGAELVAHYGTMLQFVVARPPSTIEDAFALAQEHALAAPCTLILPGVSLRHHARALLQLQRWFLHERP